MTRLESEALVVRTVEVGDSDVVATLVTERVGKLGVVARGARKGSRRLGGSLEPVHTIAVLVDDRGGDLATLKEAHIVCLRPRVASDLPSLEAAGMALRWARHLFPLRTPEPDGWRALIELLDRLEARVDVAEDGTPAEDAALRPKRELARAGLALLAAVGYGLELGACVVCGRACPEGKSACVDPVRGGLVCRKCGGAARVLAEGARRAAQSLAGKSEPTAVSAKDALDVLDIVDRAMAAHAGFDG